MPRWEVDGIQRLQDAALELFSEQGFEATRVAEIASRAGPTKRSFFNHFADKREVLLAPLAERQSHLVLREIDMAAESPPPLEVVITSLRRISEEQFERRRAAVTRRAQLIEASADLCERELGKRDALTEAVAGQAAMTAADVALLVGRAGTFVHQTAMQRWTTSTEHDSLQKCYEHALQSLQTIVAASCAAV